MGLINVNTFMRPIFVFLADCHKDNNHSAYMLVVDDQKRPYTPTSKRLGQGRGIFNHTIKIRGISSVKQNEC